MSHYYAVLGSQLCDLLELDGCGRLDKGTHSVISKPGMKSRHIQHNYLFNADDVGKFCRGAGVSTERFEELYAKVGVNMTTQAPPKQS